MSTWLTGQLDYVFLVYGLSFVLMGAVLWGLPRADSRIPWRWLAAFGLLHGVNEWMGLLALSLGDTTAFALIRLVLATGSYLCLVEFGRTGLAATGKPLVGRWIILPLLAVAGLGSLGGLSGINAAARYTLAFPGSLAAACVLWRHGRGGGSPSRAIQLAAVAMTAYAVFAGLIVPRTAFPPASVLNYDSFRATVGVPVQIVRGLLAAVMAVAFWWHELSAARQAAIQQRLHVLQLHELALASWEHGQSAGRQPLTPTHQRTWYLQQLILFVAMMGVLLAGWVATQ